MGKNFLSATANYEDFISHSSAEINGHVLKNNDGILKKAFTFFKNDNKILLLNGFSGVGKKQIAEHLLSYLDKNSIVLRYVCTESTTLDDIMLSFLKILQKKASVKNSTELDAITSVWDKIEYIISRLEDMKFVPVFYGFDFIKDENRPDVLNYIYNFAKKENAKCLIVSRTFDTDIIPEEISYVKLMVKALSKEIFETYIREFGVKVTPAMIDQLYRLSRGYFLSACLSAKIMVNQECSLNDFIVAYTNSGLKFDDFLAKTYYKLIVGTTKSAFNLFVKLHHGLNLKVLQSIGSYPEVILKTLSDNFYIYKKGELYYPAEFLKNQLESSIGDEISKKRLISYYEKQIELSPEERDFTISRVSLQAEIAYYNGEDNPQNPAENVENQNKQEEPVTEEKKQTIPMQQYQNMSVRELINSAKELFDGYNYLRAVDVLTYALDKKTEIQGSDMLYEAYNLLAKTYSKLAKWQYALYYYELLEKHYWNISDKDGIYLMQYEKAYIYYRCYKIIDAIKILKYLMTVSKDKLLLSKTCILLGNIAITASNKDLAREYYKEGISYLPDDADSALKMELFFKYAILSDEINDINNAVEYYQKCIELNDKSNKYCALAYSNLADLFYDNDLKDEARECFENAYNSDKLNENDYGMYYSLSKLIELSDKKDKDSLLKMAEEAKDHAVKSNDYNAIVDATIKLGDVYYDYPDPEKALVQYLELYRSDREEFGEHNLKMLKSRLSDIRARIGKDKFEELVPDYE